MKATCRIGSLILAICLFTCFTANGLADSKSETDQAKQQLITDWESMLAMVQTQEEIIFFALDCLDAYTANPSWTNLGRARVACTMANSALSSLVWPTHSVTRKQQYALIEAGVATEILSDYQSFDFRQ